MDLIVSVLLSEALGRDDNDAGYAVTLFTAATSLMLVRWSPESVSVNDQTVLQQQPMLNGQVGTGEARRRCGWFWVATRAAAVLWH